MDARASLRYQILAQTFGIRIDASPVIDQSSQTTTDTLSAVQQATEGVRAQIETHTTAVVASQRLQLQASSQEVEVNDPLAIDLGGDGFATTSVSQGIWFDINGDGSKELTSFVTGDDAFLAMDRNQNGIIDGGRELFGDQHGASNGFEQAAKLDSNGDGYLDAMDEQFHRLSLLSLGADHQLQQQSLDEAGIARINLSYQNTNQAINTYDSIRQLGTVETVSGLTLASADLMLGAQLK
ncbi:hypothetical protein [Aestuariirhabdus sp. LZHN29]|uniref:hypothetical protein n=1 Tax=Aestuariirhabdus sp. LZHN29 TaxID=3417462 RepID=UPI003CE7B426